jgi:adenosylcobinamide kinase/adenosylcobinamide-phosphate guanylyltransferase
MSRVILVIGGCRSGKSGFALNTAEKIAADGRIFIATGLQLDKEMKERVLLHQTERGPDWMTIDAPVQLPAAIIKYAETGRVLLVDCITMWLSNLILDQEIAPNIGEYIEDIKASLKRAACPVILVTNEVGTGIVPENRLAREYRDLVGSVNQQLAELADQVVMVVAGIPVWIKSESERKDLNL